MNAKADEDSLAIQIAHQMRQIQRRSARAHARKLARIRLDLDELQRAKPLRAAGDEPDAPAGCNA